MTIKEYFSQTQPINNDVVNEIFYANTQKITFGNNPNKYAQIEVAHIDEDTWAFGWEIADNGKLLKKILHHTHNHQGVYKPTCLRYDKSASQTIGKTNVSHALCRETN